MLGRVDRPTDGESTRRRRREVIVVKQRRGSSLSAALRDSGTLKSLGLKMKENQSDMEDIISPKSKKIVLMRRGEKRPP
jgi:hypothetical protein